MKCRSCIENKVHSIPFKGYRYKAKQLLKIVQSDICGPFKTIAIKGEKFFISFIDIYNKIAKGYIMKSKAEVGSCIAEYVNKCENLTGKMGKILEM